MASPLEQFVNNVRAMSASGRKGMCSVFSLLCIFVLSTNNLIPTGNIRELCDIIHKSEEVLLRNSAHLNTVLETLDVQQHSLGVLAVLVAKFSLPPVSSIPAICC